MRKTMKLPLPFTSVFLPLHTFVLAMLLPSTAFSCTCGQVAFNATMCEAKWVSHVRVLDNSTTNTHLNYTVRHVEVFKSPNGTAPNQLIGRDTAVLTPIFGSMCGVTGLGMGKEFLMAGTVDGSGTMQINLCLYIPLKDGKPDPLEISVLEWGMVPPGTKERLTKWKSEECQ